MKTIGFRSLTIYFALIILVGGLVAFGYRLVNNGEKWVVQSYNGHIYANSATVETGNITDTNDVLLYYSEDGKTTYSSNTKIREALLHTVGDRYSYISTSVTAKNLSTLVGYNIFTGLNKVPLSQTENIKLTVDSSLCVTAYEALKGKNGSVVMYNYKTGEVLCKVSTPTYDPLNVPSDINSNPKYSGAYIDNSILSSYTPGSIFKIITAACAIENLDNWETLTFECDKKLHVDGGTVTCLGNHGKENLQQALGHSCNIYFAKLAMELGIEKLQKTAEEMGFNQKFVLSDFTTTKSSINLEKASDLDLAWAGVGQYTTTANPMNMAILMGAIANGGTATSPILIENSSTTNINLTSKSTANELQKLLRNVASDYYNSSVFEKYNVCAKTGTAEVGGDKDPTSWIVGFSQNPQTPYAFAVAVEEGGSGSGKAKEIAISLFKNLG